MDNGRLVVEAAVGSVPGPRHSFMLLDSSSSDGLSIL